MSYRWAAVWPIFIVGSCLAQSVQFTLGVGQPVANVPIPLYLFASNPGHTPIPTGSVTINFGVANRRPNANNSVSVFGNGGTPLSPAAGYTGGSISGPSGVAVHISGNVWISNASNDSVTELLGAAVPVMPLTDAAATP